MSVRIGPFAAPIDERSTASVILIAIAIVIGTLAAVVLVVAVSRLSEPYTPLPPRLHQAAVGIPVVLAYYELVRRALGVPAEWFLAGRPGREVLKWAAIGLVLPGFVLGLELWVRGAVRLGGTPAAMRSLELLLAALGGGLLAGVLEELALRGALLRALETRWGTRIGVGGSAAVFAGLHQGHAGGGIDLLLVLSSMFAAGLFLGTVVVHTGSVWNAVVVHAGWNTVFGGLVVAAQPVGEPLGPAIFRFHVPNQTGVLTGGTAAIGASPLTTACLVVAIVVVAKTPRRWIRPADHAGRTGGDR